jgi:hypothetical protein
MRGVKKEMASREKETVNIESDVSKHFENWLEGLENHKRLMEILPFIRELDEGYL